MGQELSSIIKIKSSDNEFTELTTIDYYCGRDEYVSKVIGILGLNNGSSITITQDNKNKLDSAMAYIDDKIEDCKNRVLSLIERIQTHTLNRALTRCKETAQEDLEYIADYKTAIDTSLSDELFSLQHLYLLLNSTYDAFLFLENKDTYQISVTLSGS